jgi:hypothetical protein
MCSNKGKAFDNQDPGAGYGFMRKAARSMKCQHTIFFASQAERFIPEPVRGNTHYLLDSEDNYAGSYEFLIDQAGVNPRELGSLKTQAREAVEPLTFMGPGKESPAPGA